MKPSTPPHDPDGLSDILLRWEEGRRAGTSATPDDLCRDRPDLRDEVARRIAVLEAVYRVPNRFDDPDKTSPEAPPTSRRLPTVPGYEILGELGEGGMGVVYKARDTRLGRVVALKMVLSGARARPVERLRFRLEAEAVAALQHPNIVQVYEVGEAEDCPFLALEYLDGGNLAARMATPLPPRDAATLVRTLARAVDHAHHRGIVHRDLKPANVLLTSDGSVKIADFGLAKRLGVEGHTASGAVMGTPAYMAPEQADGRTRAIGPAADIYALGTILYEMLAGVTPFAGASAVNVLLRVSIEEPVPPSRRSPGVPRDLETICLKCLEKEIGKRYATAAELADDLDRYLAGEPIRARPVGAVERAVKWARRKPAQAALTAVLLAVVVGSLGGLAALYARAEGRRRDAEEARSQAGRSEATAKAANDFLVNGIVKAALLQHEGGQGKDVTLLQALDTAAKRIGPDLGDNPETEAAVRVMLGRAYFGHGQHAKAEEQFARGVELLAQIHGADAPETLTAQVNLAQAITYQYEHDRAEILLRSAFEGLRHVRGWDHSETLQAQNLLAYCLKMQRKFKESRELFEDLAQRCRATQGPDDELTLDALTGLALVRELLGDADAAEDLLGQVLKSTQEKYGARDLRTAIAEGDYGGILRRRKKWPEAAEHLRISLEVRRENQPANHPSTLSIQSILAEVYAAQGKHADAAAMLRACLNGYLAAPPGGYLIPWTQSRLGACLTELDKPEEAEKLLLEGWHGLRQGPNPNAKRVEEGVERLVRFYEKTSQAEKAAEWRTKLPSAKAPPKQP